MFDALLIHQHVVLRVTTTKDRFAASDIPRLFLRPIYFVFLA